jgi:Protein of unknown function (DUF3500)
MRDREPRGGFGQARGSLADTATIPRNYSEWFYWISIFGTPSPEQPWGWQIDGHHLNVNCFVLGDQLVLTPGFIGSEPVLARSGKYAGTRVFAVEVTAQGIEARDVQCSRGDREREAVLSGICRPSLEPRRLYRFHWAECDLGSQQI